MSFENNILRSFLMGMLVAACSGPEIISPSGVSVMVEADSIVLAVIGDFGSGNSCEGAVASRVRAFDPDFIITCGDNNYPGGNTEDLWKNIGQFYCDYIFNFDVATDQACTGLAASEGINRFFPTPGNHDYAGRLGLLPYLNYFTLPGNERFYDFQWGPVHFFALDSNQDIPEQRVWFEQQVAVNTQPFVIVYFHHSPYSSGLHGNAEAMQWDYTGVDLVITGHDHIYSRIERTNVDGPIYVVNGLGGKDKRRCGRHPLGSGFSEYCYDDEYGAMKIEANDHLLRAEFVNLEGLVVDAFEILP